MGLITPLNFALSSIPLIAFYLYMVECRGALRAHNKRRFDVFWNVPSESCGSVSGKDAKLDPSEFGIRTNPGQRFHGSQIVTFYEKDFGLYPAVEGTKEKGAFNITKLLNGGIPQRLDIVKHLRKAKEDLLKAIPEKNFSGLAVIDYENWRPLFAMNWGKKEVVKHVSIEEARLRYKNVTERELRLLAEHDFNKYSLLFLTATIRLGRRLRPMAKWGYYGEG